MPLTSESGVSETASFSTRSASSHASGAHRARISVGRRGPSATVSWCPCPSDSPGSMPDAPAPTPGRQSATALPMRGLRALPTRPHTRSTRIRHGSSAWVCGRAMPARSRSTLWPWTTCAASISDAAIATDSHGSTGRLTARGAFPLHCGFVRMRHVPKPTLEYT